MNRPTNLNSDVPDAQTCDYYETAVVIFNRANWKPLSTNRSTGKRASQWYHKGGMGLCPDNSHLLKSNHGNCFRCMY